MKKTLLSIFFALASFTFFAPSVLAADSGCNDGNYSLPNTTYLSPSSGSNNQDQINAAIASAPSGGSVFLKKGTYIVNGSIKLKSNVILEGDSDAIIKLKDHAGLKRKDSIMVGISTQNVEIKCFQIDGNYNFSSGNYSAAAKSCFEDLVWDSPDSKYAACESRTADRYHGRGYYTLVDINNGTNISLHNMTMQDGCNDGMRVTSTAGVRFYNNYVNAMGHEGLYANISHGIEAYGNKIAVRSSDGVRGDDCYDYSIHDNEMYSYDGKDSSFGVQIDSKRNLPVYNIQIFRNVFHDIWWGGVWLSRGNIPMHDGRYAIEIHHNLFVGNGYSRNSGTGINGAIRSDISAASIIFNNTFDGNYGYGIYDPTGRARITSNIITGTKSSKNGTGGGVGVGGGGEMSYNIFYGNGRDYTKSGTANYTANPLYFKSGADYHLMSKAGRWDPALSQWVADSQNSPAIDAGTMDSVYGEYKNEPENNGDRLNAGVYGNTSQASLTGNVKQSPMPPAPAPDFFSTVIFTGGGSDASTGGIGIDTPGGGGTGSIYIPGTGETGSDAFSGMGNAGEKYDGPIYYDPKEAVTPADSGETVTPAVSLPEAIMAPLFPQLGNAPATATASCSVAAESGGLVPCGRNTDDPSTDWNECDACDLCAVILMGQLTIEFLMKMAGIASVLSIIFAGFLYIFAVGRANLVTKAKEMVKGILVGFIIVFTAWVVVNSILTILGYIDPIGGAWYTIC